MATITGTIVFNTVGSAQYGFDVFSVNLQNHPLFHISEEQRLTDGTPLFHDRPIIRNGRLCFVSAHKRPDPDPIFKSWNAVYSTAVDGSGTVTRLTPSGVADYSPAASLTEKFNPKDNHEIR
ncbi:hypothetical protein SESBI_15890 [Sesbania bispinosa]|nr:hypothetical protein SESBI_15890 [Sesbania bispinosa]